MTMRQPAARILSASSFLLFAVLLFAQGFYCFSRPISPLDSMVYVSILEGGGQQAFRHAGSVCSVEVPGPRSECEITSTPTFNEIANYSDADFATFIRFYQVKPLYIWMAKGVRGLLHLTGFVALRVVSAVSFIVIGAIVFLWLRRHLSTPAASLIALVISAASPVQGLGKLLLPDGFSTALLLIAVYAILYLARTLWVQLAILAVLPLARPDNILFCVILGAFLIFRATPVRNALVPRLIGLVVAAGLLNTLLARATHALSYVVLFNHSFLAWTPPSTYPALHLSAHDFLHTLAYFGFLTVAIHFPLPLFFAALALADRTSWRPLRDLVAATLLTSVARLLLFPNMEERYYTWVFILCAVAMTITVAERLPAWQSWFRRSEAAAESPR